MAVPKQFKGIAKIKPVAARAKADQALDSKLGIKQGSKRDVKIDKAVGVANQEYGPGGKYAGKGQYGKSYKGK